MGFILVVQHNYGHGYKSTISLLEKALSLEAEIIYL